MLGSDMLINAVWEKIGIKPEDFQKACAAVLNFARDGAASLKRLEGRADDHTAALDEMRAQLARMEGLMAEDSLDRAEPRQLAHDAA